MVEIKMKDGGIIRLELDRQAAPLTVENFEQLIGDEFYDGLIFHRVIKDFMIQGGDPTGTGMGGPGHEIKGEFSSNGWDNPLSHKRGVVSMARSGNPDSAGSQFFITHGDATFLDGDYAAFGRVTEGMDVIDHIATVATDGSDRPLEEVAIETMRIVEDGE
ncbi:peptidylprolyl isomerase [Ruminococcaceae bacterium OttesenSCG-928-I18]|nr:peptidylprolyl isomerase [Ruminococcaceae bacterium OttesenSCG-928-I18]